MTEIVTEYHDSPERVAAGKTWISFANVARELVC